MLNKLFENKNVGYSLFIIIILLLLYIGVKGQNCQTINDLPTCNPDGIITPGDSNKVVCPTNPLASEKEDAKNLGLAMIEDSVARCDLIVEKDVKSLCRKTVYSGSEKLNDEQLLSQAESSRDSSICDDIQDQGTKIICVSRVARLNS